MNPSEEPDPLQHLETTDGSDWFPTVKDATFDAFDKVRTMTENMVVDLETVSPVELWRIYRFNQIATADIVKQAIAALEHQIEIDHARTGKVGPFSISPAPPTQS